MEVLRELAIFAGVGGGILGGQLLGWRTVCAIEINPFCREVLLRRQLDGCLPRFPIWDDARTFDGKPWLGLIDVVTGGFPCQPFSVAGQRKGENDARNMWPETARIVSEVRPEHCLFENVPGILPYLPVVIRDLRRLGYTVAKPTIIAAAALGAGHIRRRVWIYAHADSKRRVQPQGGVKDQRDRAGDSAAIPRNTSGLGQQEMREPDKECIEARGYTTPWWASEPDVARVVHGIPHRVDGAKALGNAQVPIVAATAFDLLSGG